MKYNELIIPRQTKPKRAGRGISAGRGKTAGRGTKGQGARAGTSRRSGFEGGQTPLHLRLPKLRGFKSHRETTEIVYTGQLAEVKKSLIDAQSLFEAGLVSSPYVGIKLISKGDLTVKKTVNLPRASQSAIAAIEKAGGTFRKTDRLARTKQTKAQESSPAATN